MEKRQPLFKRTCSRTSTLRSLWYIYLFPRGHSIRAPKGFHLYDCKKSVKKRKEMTTMIFRVCSLSREDNNNIVALLWRWLPLRISKRQIRYCNRQQSLSVSTLQLRKIILESLLKNIFVIFWAKIATSSSFTKPSVKWKTMNHVCCHYVNFYPYHVTVTKVSSSL